jgi:hypothetical protein
MLTIVCMPPPHDDHAPPVQVCVPEKHVRTPPCSLSCTWHGRSAPSTEQRQSLLTTGVLVPLPSLTGARVALHAKEAIAIAQPSARPQSAARKSLVDELPRGRIARAIQSSNSTRAQGAPRLFAGRRRRAPESMLGARDAVRVAKSVIRLIYAAALRTAPALDLATSAISAAGCDS